MATLFWVGGSTAYDGVTNLLATSSGGTATVALITSADSVTFDGGSAGAAVTTSANISCASLTFAATFAGSLTLSNTLTTTGSVSISAGTLNTNGKTVNLGGSFSTAGAPTISLGASQVTVNGNFTMGAGVIFNAGTSLIRWASNAGVTLAGNGQTYYDMSFYAAGGALVITGTNTWHNITFSGNATLSNTLVLSADQTVQGTFAVTGTAINRIFVESKTAGTTRTVTAAFTNLSYVDIMDIAGTGGAAPFTGTSLGDCLGNSGITFTQNSGTTNAYGGCVRWCVGSAGNWSSTANWSESSNGASGATVPLPQDTVNLDGHSPSIAANMARLGHDITCTGYASSLSISNTVTIYGNLTLASGMSFSGVQTIVFSGRGSQTITSATKTFAGAVVIACPGGSYTLQDDFITSTQLSQTANLGTFNDGGHYVTIGTAYNNANTSYANALVMSGNWTMNGTGVVWNVGNSGWTLTATGSTITIANVSGTTKTFGGLGKTYGNLQITGGTGEIVLTGANTFNALTLGAGAIVALPSATTTTVSSFVASGNPVSNPGYLRLPGLSKQYASAPSAAPLNLSGDLTIDVKVALDTWTPTILYTLAAKWGSSPNFGYFFGVTATTGTLNFQWSSNGTTSTSVSSTVAPGLSAGTIRWVRVVRDNTAGTVKFYTSPDDITYTQLGTNVSYTPGSIFASADVFGIGATTTGTGSLAQGNFYRVRMFSDTTQSTKVFDADFSGVTAGAASFTESSSNAATVTLNGAVTQAWGRAALIASTAGSQATISKASGVISQDYLSIQDSKAAAGATWYAGTHSANVSNNTNWIFTAAPIGNFFLVI